MCSSFLSPLYLPRELVSRLGEYRPSRPYEKQSLQEPGTETLMLVPSERCNLNCAYCYEHHKHPRRMELGTARAAVRKAFAALRPGKRLKIEFRGGEPFLEFGFIRELCDWVMAEFPAGSFFFYAITNGTCFTETARDWLSLHRDVFVLLLSVDGGRETHNRNRSDSFDRIDFDFVLRTWPRPCASTTLVPGSADSVSRDLQFLMDRGFDIRANFEFAGAWTSGQLEQLARGFRQFADHVLSRRQTTRVNLLSRYGVLEYADLPDEAERERRRLFLACNAGTYRWLVAADGGVYPCQTFAPSVSGPRQDAKDGDLFAKLKSEDLHPRQCRCCRFFFLCQICPGFSYRSTGDLKWRNPSFCDITRIRTFLAAYYWGLRLSDRGRLGAMEDEDVAMTAAAIAGLYRGEKVYA